MFRRTVAAVDPLQPVASFTDVDASASNALAPRRLNFLLIDGFAGLAIFLAALGLYGVMAFQVTQRTRELGIRIALGATRGSVRGLVLRTGLSLAVAGSVAGVLLSLALSHTMTGMLYGVTTRDTATFATAPILLLIVAALACYLPARRATSIDPVIALRN